MRINEAGLIDWPQRMARLREQIREKEHLFDTLVSRWERFEEAATELNRHCEDRAATILRNKATAYHIESGEVYQDILAMEAELREMPVKSAQQKQDEDAATSRALERSM